jgi:signal transduction histidine kinase
MIKPATLNFPPATIEELKKIIALKELPDAHLQWLIDHSEVWEYEDGATLIRTGDPVDYMWILSEGSVSFYLDVNGKLVPYFTFENNVQTGGVGGLLPYSRMKNSPGYTYAVGKVRGLALHKKYFPEMEQLNPDFIQKLVGYMTERARYFATQQLQQEKVSALGQLAAGIAHELNNPASAINRISSELAKRLKQNYELTEKLLEHGINPQQIKSIRSAVQKKDAEKKEKLSALERIEREDALSDWLEKNNFNIAKDISETFTEAGFTTADFETIRTHGGVDAFPHIINWLDNVLSSQRIVKDMDDASCRISNLVGAIKSHVHMDRTNEMQPTNVHKDIDNTITLLGYKLREKNITVKKKYCDNLPDVPAYVGELNQVWTNLIDNSIFAVPKNGEIDIETSCDNKNLTVKVIDNGSGIPKEIMSRIFDPFFTTKKVGQGTGIGLDLVNRIVKRHNGEIKVNSVPGKTEFAICIPLVPVKQEH